uniref:C2 domain-containing protein n=1 Tax=Ciona savignyi TaxID=51511 RepID=H2ZAD9_CIOSA
RTDRSTLSEKVEDFQIRLKVICARQLTGSNIKPVVKVKAGKNQAKITRIRKGSAPIWNELLMFNFNESLKELYDYVFEFALNNSRKLRSDALIGSFKLDVGTIYDQPGHAFVRKWLLLTDPDDASNSPKGYLKITVCVLGAGDQPPDESAGKDDDNDDVEGNLLTPAGASLRAATFTLRVYGAEDLPQMDSGSLKSMKQRIGLGEEGDITKTLVDPFLSFIFAGKKRKTQIIKETNQPEWNEELNLPLKFPSMCDSIKLTIKDWDRIGSDDPIGTVIIPLSRISSTGEEANGAGTSLWKRTISKTWEVCFPPTFGPSFVNFYGSPREFSKLGDSLDDLNIGKGIGCAYRGRAMVELVTTMDEEGAEPAPPSQPINDDQIALVKKYMRRRRYRLVVGFESANMIRKPLERIEFEVSIGNYGNKFDTEVGAASSTTEPGNPVFDGVNYHYMAWTSKKPILMVTSQWEDISFRLYAMNLILRTCERMEGQINHLNELVKVEADEIEIASEIVSILDMLILETSKKLPDPRGRTASNQLDRRIHRQRLQTFVAICEEAKDLRQNCTDAQEAISAINDFLERLKLVSYEPQNSLPDVVVWMISDNKRIAYARIPAYEILYSPEKPEFCGRYCAKPCTITLKYPTANAKSKKHYKVPAQLRIIAWLGRAADQDSFEFHSRGQISVYADTFETEMKILVKGWIADGYTDITGEIPLPKSAFSCPPGWVWDGDWKINSELALLYDTSQGHMHVLEDAFEYQYRFPGGTWEPEKITNGKHEEIPNLSSLRIPDGWEWENEWTVDSNRACDEDGWEYSAPDDDTAGEVAWSTIEKTYSTSRRRRLIRNRVCIDQKVSKKAEKTEELIGEGWEYATTMGSQFHIMPKMLDLVRRRRWVRKMITSEASGPAAIFNLDTSIVIQTVFEFSQTNLHKQIAKKSKKIHKIPTPKIYIVYKDVSKLHLRAYIYQGRDLLPMDQDSFSDPVVMVSFLNQTHRTEVQQHTLNPVWDQTLMIDIQFYGDLEHLQRNCPDVLCEVFDKDDLVSSGRERRKIVSCEHWGDADERLALYILRTFPHVSEHVETRPLFYDALPNIEQGRLQLWVDMFPKEYGDPGLPYNIEPRKPSKYFLRMIVWNCSEIPMMDVSMLGDKMSDIYFKGWISGLEHKRQKTDVHYRSLDGTGNFNWRFVFPFDYLPQERMVHVSKKEHLWSLDKTVTKFPPVLNIQVWDNDLFGPNEYISEIILPITNMPKCCKFQRFCTLENVPDMQGNCKMEMLNLFDQNTPLKGWWPLYKVVDGVREQAGKLEMSVEIVSEEEEVEKPAGQGRDEPNMNPKLEKPNRPATSFAWFSSPFKSLRYIIWRKYKWIILGVLGVLVLAAFIVLFIYSFPHWFSSKGCMPFI